MATINNTTRRSILAGLGVAIAGATIAGSALAAQPDTLRQQAEDLIRAAREVRIGLHSYPGHGGLWVMEPIDEPQSEQEMEVWHRLKRSMHDNPELKDAVKELLRIGSPQV
jgi:hypothetical protein